MVGHQYPLFRVVSALQFDDAVLFKPREREREPLRKATLLRTVIRDMTHVLRDRAPEAAMRHPREDLGGSLQEFGRRQRVVRDDLPERGADNWRRVRDECLSGARAARERAHAQPAHKALQRVEGRGIAEQRALSAELL